MKVVSPRSLEEALAALEHAGPETRLLAGGTDLMIELDVGRTRPDLLVDLSHLSELRAIAVEKGHDGAGGLRIGALATCTDLLRSPAVRERADVLAAAARDFGAVQIRNRATIGGNLGTASPAADLNPVLFALGARVRLVSARGSREVPAHAFVTGYRTNARALDELIESVLVPARPPDERRAFRKVGTRKAQSIAKVVVALAARVEGGRVVSLSAAAGSVAERTVALPTLARRLAGSIPDEASIAEAARACAAADVSPRTDVRSTAVYRRIVLGRILGRILREVLLR